MDLKEHIRNIPDWPKPGIVFRDITTLLTNASAYDYALDRLTEQFRNRGIEKVLGIEARGFIFGGALASRLGVGFVAARKPGKLPVQTLREEYSLEYGTSALEIHRDSLHSGERVLVVDDLLATGGTLAAAVKLVERSGAQVAGVGVVVVLSYLGGLRKLRDHDVFSLVQYDSE
jgi:adenine phosphoribosyltransferase